MATKTVARRIARKRIARDFQRTNVGMWVEQHGYYSGFRSPQDDVDRVLMSEAELDIIESLWNDGKIRRGRVFAEGVYASYWYWADGMSDAKVCERALLMLLARGAICVRFDAAGNDYYELSPFAKKLPMSKTRVVRAGGAA